MRRSRRTQSGAAVSMFPFLAVLLCIMGALIMLLVLLAQQAKVQAASSHDDRLREAKIAEQRFVKQRRKLRSTQAHLRREIEEISSKLAEERLALSHVEKHARTLRKRLRELESLLATMEQDPSRQDATAKMTLRLNQLRQKIAALEIELEEAEEQAAQQQVSYAIVPYEGGNQTLRRPIYIECRSDAVILQPEGIRLTVADFHGPLDPSNPLAAALRSANEFFADNALAGQGPVGEPYPFFLVRPDGVVSYAVARAALRSWGSEFGYELVEQDWNLKYPPEDPGLAKAEQEAVQRARQRQVQLARIAPSYYGSRRPTSFQSFDEESDPDGGDGKRGRGGYGRGGGRGDFVGSGNGPSGGESSRIGSEFGADSQSGNSGESDDSSGSGLATSGPTSATGESARGDGSSFGGGASNGGSSTRGSTSGNSATDSAANGSADGEGTSAQGDSSSQSSAQPLADGRGRDWAVPHSARGSIGIRRPIRILVRADHLVVMPDDRGQRQGKIIPLRRLNADAVDDLVSAVWDRTDTWGTAGEGMHWRPELRIQGETGTEQRVNDLARMLDNSGMEVQIAPMNNAVRIPPVRRTR